MSVLSLITTILLVLLIIGAVLVIIFDDCDSGRKLAWILVITVLPIVGLILYLMFGINYRHHWFFNQKHKKYLDTFKNDADERLINLFEGDQFLDKVKEDYKPLVTLLATDFSNTVSGGNNVEVMTNGHRKFELLTKNLLEAKESIHMEYFLFGKDEGSRHIKEILMQKAKEGVKVRFIHENIANFGIPNRYFDEMKKAGVEVVRFTNPRKHVLNLVTSLNFRDHRKIVVIDGRIGFTGGMNIKDRYFLEWRDTHMRITGNAVASLQNSFLNAWITAGGKLDKPYMSYFEDSLIDGQKCEKENFADNLLPEKIDITSVQPTVHNTLIQVVPDEPGAPWPITQMGLVWVANNAKEYLYLQTPYFVPPEPVLDALKSAALSGIDVRLMIPQKADSFYMGPANKSFFSECLEAGIRIYEREGEFIHSKTFVCDDYISEIGTGNLDYRSFSINYEVNTFIFSEEAAKLNKRIFLADLEKSEEINFEQWEQRSLGTKLVERLLRLNAPLL